MPKRLALVIITKVLGLTFSDGTTAFVINLIGVPVFAHLVEGHVDIPIKLLRILITDTHWLLKDVKHPQLLILVTKFFFLFQINGKLSLSDVLVIRIQ